jgi:hypothetical protein
MQALKITALFVCVIYLGGFIGSMLDMVMRRWHLIEQELLHRNTWSKMRFRVTAVAVAVLMSVCWPWLFKVEVREWYAKVKARKGR